MSDLQTFDDQGEKDVTQGIDALMDLEGEVSPGVFPVVQLSQENSL